jgi:hypothetical protein
MRYNKLEWLNDNKLSKLSNIEKLSLFKIRRLKKDIETIERENEELLKKIKSNKEIIRKYNKGLRDKEKLITSILIDNNLMEVNFIRYCKERIGVYKKSKNYYWNIRLILNGKVFKDLSLCSDKNLSILLEKYGYLNLSVLKKIELLKKYLGNNIKKGFEIEREKYFSYENHNFIGFNYRMIKIFEEKLKSK